MACQYPSEQIQSTIDFHGHFCPGLCIGIRAAELARSRWPEAIDYDLVAVTETDMCGVDAIQHLLGCTFGKGNLVHRDWGKMAFSFYHRPSGKGFRALLKPDVREGMDEELGQLMAKVYSGRGTEEDEARLEELRGLLQERFMSLGLEEMWEVTELEAGEPRPPYVLKSLCCESCGEMVMESRTRRLSGRTLCIPCFEKIEQKV